MTLKVGLVTNVNERCGISEYGNNLVTHVGVDKDIEFKIVARPFTIDSIWERAQDVNVVHFNYSAGIMPLYETELHELKRHLVGKKLVITLHDSFDARTRGLAALKFFDKIVVHEQAIDSPFPPEVCVIPQGIVLCDVSGIEWQMKLGTAGFPFPWKGFYPMAAVAKKLNIGCLAMLSTSDAVDAKQMKEVILDTYPSAEVVDDWPTHLAVVRRLAECAIVLYPYDLSRLCTKLPFYGISAAVRFGLASGRPVIISQCRQFNDLWQYLDEVYLVENGNGSELLANLEKVVREIFRDIALGCERRPKRLLADMSWTRCAQLYVDLYKALVS